MTEIKDKLVNAESLKKLHEYNKNTYSQKENTVFWKNNESEEINPEDLIHAENILMNDNKTTVESKINQFSDDIDKLKFRVGYFDNYVVGIQVDYENKTYTRLVDAEGLNSGSDFDKFSMFGGRKRCNVTDDGTIVAYYGDENYTENGSNGQVMVYQPKFYYMVKPLKIEPINTGIGYHLRKANYYVSDKPVYGFKLHPAFYNINGDEIDYILMGAYEGCIWDASENVYVFNDEQIMSTSEDKFSSIANAKPASGTTQNLTRPNIELMAKNRGLNWHLENIQIASMNQLLMLIEYACNLQNGLGLGVVNISDNTSYNCSSITGSTYALGNISGMATSTINTKGETSTTETTNGKVSISYRGLENPWGNIWEFVYGINIWGDGNMGGGQPYICTNLTPSELKNSDNYEGAGFTVTNANGYISAMGYSIKYDWLFIPSETVGNSSLPIGDYCWITENLNGYRIARVGGRWTNGSAAGGFCWSLISGVGVRSRIIGGRVVYVPTYNK